MEKLFNKLFPLKCLNCGQIGECICDNCLYDCDILTTQYCIYCDKPSFKGITHKDCYIKNINQITQNLSVFKYHNLVRDVIKTSKFGSKRFITLKKLSYEACILLNEWGFEFIGFVVVPVPSSKSSLKSRGFNQAELISEIVARKLNLKIDNSILNRKLDTTHQYKLKKYDRAKNLKGSFEVTKNIEGLKILIVDDIITTGSTFKEIAKVLYKEKASQVRCLSISKKIKYLKKVKNN